MRKRQQTALKTHLKGRFLRALEASFSDEIHKKAEYILKQKRRGFYDMIYKELRFRITYGIYPAEVYIARHRLDNYEEEFTTVINQKDRSKFNKLFDNMISNEVSPQKIEYLSISGKKCTLQNTKLWKFKAIESFSPWITLKKGSQLQIPQQLNYEKLMKKYQDWYFIANLELESNATKESIRDFLRWLINIRDKVIPKRKRTGRPKIMTYPKYAALKYSPVMQVRIKNVHALKVRDIKLIVDTIMSRKPKHIPNKEPSYTSIKRLKEFYLHKKHNKTIYEIANFLHPHIKPRFGYNKFILPKLKHLQKKFEKLSNIAGIDHPISHCYNIVDRLIHSITDDPAVSHQRKVSRSLGTVRDTLVNKLGNPNYCKSIFQDIWEILNVGKSPIRSEQRTGLKCKTRQTPFEKTIASINQSLKETYNNIGEKDPSIFIQSSGIINNNPDRKKKNIYGVRQRVKQQRTFSKKEKETKLTAASLDPTDNQSETGEHYDEFPQIDLYDELLK